MIWLLTNLALAITLNDAREQATQQAIAVEQAEASLAAARGDALSALGATLPSVTGFVSGSTGAGLNSLGFQRPVQNQLGVGLSGSWTLIAPSAWGAAAAARQDVAAREALLQWAQVDARRRATNAFAQAVSASLSEAAWRQASEDADRAASAIEAQVEHELLPPSDGARARADAHAAAARLRSAEATTVAACAALQDVMRSEITGACDVEAEVWPSPTTSSSVHPALAAAEATLSAAERRRFATMGGYAPTVSATGTGAQYTVTGGESGFGWSLGASLDVPLVAGGAGLGATRAASASQRGAELSLEQQQRDLTVALVGAQARYTAAIEVVEAQQASLDASERALHLIQRRFEEGLENLTTLLDARRSRDTAAASLAAAQGAAGAALAEVEASRGIWQDSTGISVIR